VKFGWKARREYTVMGDEVNLAARLMSKAQPGQILISERVYERVRDSFDAEAVEPLHLKGKSLPVQAYAVRNVAAPTITMDFSSQMPFIGHDVFMLSLTYTLKQAASGRRRAIALVGDAGIGKTRIAQQPCQKRCQLAFSGGMGDLHLTQWTQNDLGTLIAQLLGVESVERCDAGADDDARAAARTGCAGTRTRAGRSDLGRAADDVSGSESGWA